MRFYNQRVLNGADGTTTVAGPAFAATSSSAVSVQAVIAGTGVTGTLKIQASNTVGQPLDRPANLVWSDIASTAVSAAGTYMIGRTEIAYNYVRVQFVPSGGTGTTITADFTAIAYD
jgi:hypothetical protein